MDGNCTTRPTGSRGTEISNWESPVSFKHLAFFILIISSCSGGVYRDGAQSGTYIDISGLRKIADYGPAFGPSETLIEPAAMTIDNLGEIFIADKGSNSLLKFSRDFELLIKEGGTGDTPGGFNRPSGLAADDALNIYVADPGNNRIIMLDRNLRYAKTIDSYFDQKKASRNFIRPEAVAIDPEGNLWVSDYDRILKINPFGELEIELSSTSETYLGIRKAGSIAASADGIIAVADQDNGMIYLLSSYGNILISIKAGKISGIVWKNRTLWTLNSFDGTICAYNSNGVRIYEQSLRDTTARPGAVAFDSSGKLIIIDGQTRKITVYEIIVQGGGKAG